MNSVIDRRKHYENLSVLFRVVRVKVHGLFSLHETHCRIMHAETFLRMGNADIRRNDDVRTELFYLFDNFFRVDVFSNAGVDEGLTGGTNCIAPIVKALVERIELFFNKFFKHDDSSLFDNRE